MRPTVRRSVKTLAATAATAAMIALGATAASAHVTVNPDDTGANGSSHLTFNMPNESATAKVSKLEVKLPTDTPLTAVSVKPIDGWTEQVITTDLPKTVTVNGSTVTKAPTSVLWTADAAHELGQNQYQSFSISVSPLPAAGTTVTLPAVQTYTDGSVVNWDQKTVEGQPEPEHPAPSFTTTAEDGATASPSAPVSTAPAASQTSDNAASVWGIVLGAAGFILGAAALGIVLSRGRNPSKK